MVPIIGGNVFVMGAVLGFAESTSAMFSGYLMIRFGANFTYNISGTLASACYILLYYGRRYLLEGTGIGGAIVLYLAMFGLGGAYNSFFVIMELEMPAEWLGQTLVLSLAMCTLFVSLVP